MNQPAQRYIFRFIHQPCPKGWTVRDTVSGQTNGIYASEDEAVLAALAETSLRSEYRNECICDAAIPLE